MSENSPVTEPSSQAKDQAEKAGSGNQEPPGSLGRVLVIGLLAVAALCGATVYSDLVLQGSWIAHNALPIGALTLFLLVVTLSGQGSRGSGAGSAASPRPGKRRRWPAGRRRPVWALTRLEALLVYAMLLVAAGIPSVGLTLPVLSVAVAPSYYPGTAAEAVTGSTASWLRVNDPEVVRQYFHGLDPGASVPWRAWTVPLAAWSAFALLLYTAFLCIALLLRRAWVEDERLSFPLVQVPLELVGPDSRLTINRSFFRNPFAWAGIAIPTLLHSLTALHAHWPAIPAVLVTPIRVGDLFVDWPWNALSNLRAFIYFSVIGLTYLLSSEVSLSLWFFFLVSRAEVLLFAALGFDDRTQAEVVGFSPSWFVTTQMWGALFFYGALLLAEGLRSAWREQRQLERQGDREEAATLRLAFAGLGGSLLLLGLWLRAAGGGLPVQLGSLLLWMLAMLSLTRLVCAGGLLLIDTNYLPRDIVYRVFGTGIVRPPDLAVLTYTNTVFAYYPQLTMLPFLFNAVKLGDEAGLRAGTRRAARASGPPIGRCPGPSLRLRRSRRGGAPGGSRRSGGPARSARGPGWRQPSPRWLIAGVAAAILLAIPLSFALALPLIYHRGALALSEFHLGGMARQNFTEMAGYLASPSTPQTHTPLSLGVGVAVMAALIALRRTVAWWPFSPLGYLVGSSWTVMHHLWFCVLLGWIANGLVRRYGGLREFLRFRPFFLGLVLGEFLTAAAWMGIDALLGIRGHNVFPGPG